MSERRFDVADGGQIGEGVGVGCGWRPRDTFTGNENIDEFDLRGRSCGKRQVA